MLLLGLSLHACRLSVSPDSATAVTNLRFAPSAFDSFARNTEMKYTLRDPATVSVYIVRRDPAEGELLVKTLVEGLAETRGSHSITWIGDTDGRLFAPTGVYFGVVKIEGGQFQTIVQVFHY